MLDASRDRMARLSGRVNHIAVAAHVEKRAPAVEALA